MPVLMWLIMFDFCVMYILYVNRDDWFVYYIMCIKCF